MLTTQVPSRDLIRGKGQGHKVT